MPNYLMTLDKLFLIWDYGVIPLELCLKVIRLYE